MATRKKIVKKRITRSMLAEKAYRRIVNACKKHDVRLATGSPNVCAIGRLSQSYKSNFDAALEEGVNGFTAEQCHSLEAGFERRQFYTIYGEYVKPRDPFYRVGLRLRDEATNGDLSRGRLARIVIK